MSENKLVSFAKLKSGPNLKIRVVLSLAKNSHVSFSLMCTVLNINLFNRLECSRISYYQNRPFSYFVKLHNALGSDPFKSESLRRCS